jgi:hypothetical protein
MHPLLFLACIKFIYNEKQDFINALNEFVINIIAENPEMRITPENVSQKFAEVYSLRIPIIPMEQLLTRLSFDNLLEFDRYEGEWRKTSKFPNEFLVKQKNASEIEDAFNRFIKEFMDYCDKNLNRQYTFNEAENLLLLFFKDRLFDYLDNSIDIGSLVGTSDNDEMIIVSSFVEKFLTDNPNYTELITAFAVGNLLLGTLLSREFIPEENGTVDCHCYLDADILFEIIGVNFEDRQKAYKEFLILLKEKGFKLRVFQHTYNEVFNNLDRACRDLERPTEYGSYQNRTLRFFKDPKVAFTEADAREFVIKSKNEIKELGIEIWPAPSPHQAVKHQIDVEELERKIITKYSRGQEDFEPDPYLIETIRVDIKSIQSLYKLRKFDKPTSYSELKNVMVTTNQTLVKIVKDFQNESLHFNKNVIPVLLSDLTIGTIVWLNSIPEKIEQFAKAKVISKILSIMEPSNDLLEALATELRKAVNNDLFTENQAAVLFEDLESRKQLTLMTLGSVERVHDHTPFELWEIRQEEFTKPIRDKLKKTTSELDYEQRKSAEKDEVIAQMTLQLRNTVYFRATILSILTLLIPSGLYFLLVLHRFNIDIITNMNILNFLDNAGQLLDLGLTLTGLPLLIVVFATYNFYYKLFCSKLGVTYNTPKFVVGWHKFLNIFSTSKSNQVDNAQND